MIVVFGSVALDLVARVHRIPRPGESVRARSHDRVAGSKGGNQALAAARSGAPTAHVGTVGDDAEAAPALAHLTAAGVDLSGVRRSATAPTGLCHVTVADGGENTVVVAAGANADTRVEQLEARAFGAGDTLVLQMEITPDQNAAAVRLGRRRGARVLLNVAPAGPVPPDVLRLLDVLVVNEHEAMLVCREAGLDAAAPHEAGPALHARFGCSVVVTLGAAGAVSWHDGHRYAVTAPAVTPVDTTGAGDTFIGAFAAALDADRSWGDALRLGAVAGSLACEGAGAQPSIPRLDDIAAREGESALERSELGSGSGAGDANDP